jgi:hypothetical protein
VCRRDAFLPGKRSAKNSDA